MVPLFSIAIPLYNEEECVERCVTELVDALDAAYPQVYELILVVNGSQDRTGEICRQMAQRYGSIRTVGVAHNLGYGGGILQGLSAAEGEFVGFMCGDGQVAPKDLIGAMRTIENGPYDLVKALRVTRGDGWIRRLNSIAYNTLFRLLFGTRTRDINAMPKFWRRSVAPALDLTCTDWFIDAEILIKASHRGLRIYEMPIDYLRRAGGRSVVRLSTVLQFLRNALHLIRSGKIRSWKKPVPLPVESNAPLIGAV